MADRRRHPEEFKREAVRLMAERGDKTVEEVAADLGVSSGQLYKWRSQYEPSKGQVKHDVDTLLAENKRLKRELDRSKQERDILKKSVALFVRGSG